MDYHQRSLAIAEELSDRAGIASSLNNLGLAFLRTDQLNKAKLTYLQALEVLESLRGELDDSDKVSLIDTQVKTYDGLQKVLVEMGETTSALEISERSRARVFVELLTRQLSGSSDNPSKEEPITFPKLEQLQVIAREQNATLVQYSQIQYSDLGKFLYIWVIQPTGEIDFRQVDLANPDSELVAQAPTPPSSSPTSDSEEVRGLVAETRATVIVTANGNQTETLKRNHELLIEPIADLLPDDPEERVIFIPDGSLFFVPFPALQDEDGTYLIEKHTILTAPAIQVLDLTRDLRENGNRSTSETASEHLIVGNPTMPSLRFSLDEPTQPLTSLPGAEREALSIAQLNNSQALIGEQATESTIVEQMPQARIIHLATHGLLDYGIPEASLVRDVPGAIALAPSDTDDGLLTSAEILDLNLNAELVVLSACDTGRGNITSDGVIGLSRSLIMAGVPSVVVSLWSVPDAPTAELMTEFYRQMEQTPDKAQALRQAMLKTMETHPNPRDWAAFTLIGEAE
jgi:CHAT domain-containing protein